jgi:hypothetical protein
MSSSPLLESLILLSAAIDAKEEKIDITMSPERRRQLSVQLGLLRRRLSEEYNLLLAASEEKREFAEAPAPEDR